MAGRCEFVVDGALLYLDIAYSVRGIVADSDDDWVLITSKKGKKVRAEVVPDILDQGCKRDYSVKKQV